MKKFESQAWVMPGGNRLSEAEFLLGAENGGDIAR